MKKLRLSKTAKKISIAVPAFIFLAQVNYAQNITSNGATTQNYVPLFTGATTPSIIAGNSQIGQNGTNVGVGFSTLSSIAQPFHVNGRARFDLNTVASTPGTGRFYLTRGSNISQECLLSFSTNGTSTYDWVTGTYNSAAANQDYVLSSWTGRAITAEYSTANVAIGNTGLANYLPKTKLHVGGDFMVSTGGATPASAAYIKNSGGAYTIPGGCDYSWFADYGTGIYHPAAYKIGFAVNGSPAMQIGNGSFPYVGVGNTNPQYPLDVLGNVHVPSGNYYYSGTMTGTQNYLATGSDGTNSAITSVGSSLLMNYYTSQDVAICTGPAQGYLTTGKNVEIGGPTREPATALNIRATSTNALKLRNSSNAAIFTVDNVGNTTVAGNITVPAIKSTTAGTYNTVLVDASGNLVKGGVNSTSSVGWALGGNASGGATLGTLDASDLVLVAGGATPTTGVERMRISGTTGNVSLPSGAQITLKDGYHGLGYFNTYFNQSAGSSATINGPVLYGYGGGALATSVSYLNWTFSNNPNIALSWDAAGRIFIGGTKMLSGPHADALLQVSGKVVSKSFYVTIDNWADYVFNDNYKAMPLDKLKEYVTANHHLPEVPSEEELKTNGLNVGEMDKILMKKIEELTLYIIDLKAEVNSLKEKTNK